MKFTEKQIRAKIDESAGQLTRKDAEEILRNQAEHDAALGVETKATEEPKPEAGKKAKKA